MNLKQAREQGKMDEFIKEHEGKFPPANKKRFDKLVKIAASGTAKPSRGTSRKPSRGG